jgi:DNA-binding GntR family transcriptional regulator
MATSSEEVSILKGPAPAAHLARRAAESVRELIRRGELLPGEKIRQVEVAKLIGVSRSPLREALRTLEAEGLVHYETNRGYIVSRLRLEELAEIYRLRILIEGEIIASIKKPTSVVIRQMERCVGVMEAAMKHNDFPSISESYRDFHRQLFSLSNLKIFRREVERLWQLTDTYHAAYVFPPYVAAQSLAKHREVVAALKANDISKVVEIETDMRSLYDHIIVGYAALR